MINSFLLIYRRIQDERHNISFFFVTSVVGLISSFLLVIAFANLVDKTAYGTYQYIISIASVIGAFSLTGIGPAFVRAIGKKEYGFLKYGQTKSLQWSLLPILIGCLVSVYYYFNDNSLIASSVFISVFIVNVTQYFSRYIFILNGFGSFFKSNLIQTIQALAPVVFLLPVLFLTQDPLILAAFYFGSIALGTLITNLCLKTSQVLKQYDLTPPNKLYNLNNLKFAAHHSLINILNIMTANFDKILLFQSLGAHQTASYIIAITLPNRIKFLIKQFEPYIFSKFANHSASAVLSKLQSKFFLGLILSIPFFIGYACAAPFIFNLLLPEYESMTLLSIIYALSIFNGVSFIPYAVLKAHAEEKEFYIYNLISSFTQIVSLVIGIILAGLPGAIMGKMLSALINTAIVYLLAMRTR